MKELVAVMSGKCSGSVVLKKEGTKTKIIININGLKPNSSHAFHIHETGDLRDGCNSLGGHYNPFNKNHGGPRSKDRHVGDLGNITSDKNGIVKRNMTNDLIKLSGKYSVLGRGFVIHEGKDDLGKGCHTDSLTTGHAGARIACGVIGYSIK